jgi:hypothetical protein
MHMNMCSRKRHEPQEKDMNRTSVSRAESNSSRLGITLLAFPEGYWDADFSAGKKYPVMREIIAPNNGCQ